MKAKEKCSFAEELLQTTAIKFQNSWRAMKSLKFKTLKSIECNRSLMGIMKHQMMQAIKLSKVLLSKFTFQSAG